MKRLMLAIGLPLISVIAVAVTAGLRVSDVADSLLGYARSSNVSRIVVGKQAGPLWRRLWRA